MGVKLDWNIERETAVDGGGEHPEALRRRRQARRRTLAVILLSALIVAVAAGAIMARLWYVEHEIERQLRDTVAAEMAALRIGDIAAYLNVQRSASDAWMLGQTDRFWQYQELKAQYDVDLTGNVLAVAIDDNRGRVLVEEIISGQRFQQLWFYWRFADGWRHVPRDVTFWGEERNASGTGFTVTYGAVDAALVDALLPGLERLWGQGCALLECPTALPALAVRVMPDPAVEVSWSPDETNVLRINSPLVDRALADEPLPQATARRIAGLLAERIVLHARNGSTADPGTDAAFLQGALESWLVGRFLGDGGALGSSFVESLVQAYGERSVALLARGFDSNSSISALALVFTTPLDALRADWREFLQWRLALEPYLLARGDYQGVLALYDDLAQAEALRLINTPGAASQPPLTVLGAVTGPGTDGAPRAWAVVQYPDGSEGQIAFRLVEGAWRRSIPDAAFAAADGG